MTEKNWHYATIDPTEEGNYAVKVDLNDGDWTIMAAYWYMPFHATGYWQDWDKDKRILAWCRIPPIDL